MWANGGKSHLAPANTHTHTHVYIPTRMDAVQCTHPHTHSLGASCPLGCLSFVRRLWHITVHQHAGMCSVWLSDLRVSRLHPLMRLWVCSWFAHNILGSLYPSSLVFFFGVCVFWDSSATSSCPHAVHKKRWRTDGMLLDCTDFRNVFRA